jgi:hypothetical protein
MTQTTDDEEKRMSLLLLSPKSYILCGRKERIFLSGGN